MNSMHTIDMCHNNTVTIYNTWSQQCIQLSSETLMIEMNQECMINHDRFV